MSIVKLTTCEGTAIEIKAVTGVKFIELPLKQIKEYRFSEALGRMIEIHFIEVFELNHDYYIKDKDSDPIEFFRWSSIKIK